MWMVHSCQEIILNDVNLLGKHLEPPQPFWKVLSATLHRRLSPGGPYSLQCFATFVQH